MDDYERGYQAYYKGQELSSYMSQAWVDGWLDAEDDDDYYDYGDYEPYDDGYYYGDW